MTDPVYPWSGEKVTPIETPNYLRRINVGAVSVLRRWINQGETDGNNRGSFVMGLTHGFVGSWCAALQHRAETVWAEEHGVLHPIPWSRKVHSARWLLKETARIGRYVALEDVDVGDYICLARGLSYQGHAQRCSYRHGSGIVSIIDGNVGSYERTRGRVREVGPIDLRTVKFVGAARLWR